MAFTFIEPFIQGKSNDNVGVNIKLKGWGVWEWKDSPRWAGNGHQAYRGPANHHSDFWELCRAGTSVNSGLRYSLQVWAQVLVLQVLMRGSSGPWCEPPSRCWFSCHKHRELQFADSSGGGPARSFISAPCWTQATFWWEMLHWWWEDGWTGWSCSPFQPWDSMIVSSKEFWLEVSPTVRIKANSLVLIWL